MATATENPKHQNPNEDWTVVVPRRGKKTRNPSPKTLTLVQNPWIPSDSAIDRERESKLIQKIQFSIRKLENSDFYRVFLNQLENPQILQTFSRVLASESQMQMVIYGIGSIESYDSPRLQLALAILLERKFNWIGDIEIFDPILSLTESRVLESFGCSVLSINEQGRREVKKPTLFFMPHCEAILYDNLLETNWRAPLLNRIVLFGNSFGKYEQFVSEFNTKIADSWRFLLFAQRVAKEVGIETVSEDFFRAFHETSWHFFELDQDMDLCF
ncbi:sensitivity to red light reduced protein (SRR1) [Tasmannia lanceolata]|uniref:sensitivity to red light reduced protein (SRR1) n=1 Tax=Tasmannia lanceolata TaxID=3420 RepID=UPI004062F3BB